MAKFFSLLKVQFLSYFGLNKTLKLTGAKKAKKLSGLISAAVLYIFIFGFFGVTYSKMYAEILIMSGNIKALLPLMLAMSALISFFFSFYTTTSALYGFKDYDFLTSLPISTGKIVCAKLAFSYLSDLFFALIIMIPSTVIYANYAPLPNAVGLVAIFLMTIVSPLLPMTISVFLGALVAFISSRFKRKNIAQIIFYLLVMILCFGSGFIGGLNPEEMLDPTNIISKIYFIFPLALMGMDNIVYALLFVLTNVLPFVLVGLLVIKTYKKMNALLSSKKTVKNYKYKGGKIQGQKKALFKKEIKRLFSNAMYVMNCLMGSIMAVIMMVAAGILVRVMGKDLGVDLGSMIVIYLPLAFSFCFMLSPPTSCSISLEGSAFWIIRTSPVDMVDLFNAKLKLNATVAVVPAVVAALAFGIIAGLNIINILLATAVGGTIAMLGGEVGLLMNILLPNLKWDNENVPIKQGASVLITLLFAFVYTGIQFLIVYFVPVTVEGILLICLALALVLSVIAYALIYYKGEQLLAKKL